MSDRWIIKTRKDPACTKQWQNNHPVDCGHTEEEEHFVPEVKMTMDYGSVAPPKNVYPRCMFALER